MDYTILNNTSTVLTTLILALFLVYSAVFTIADLFPVRWRFFRKIKELRIEHTLEVLEKLGVDTKQVKKNILLSRIPSNFRNKEELDESTKRLCKTATLDIKSEIGIINPIAQNKFINLMGCSTNSEFAEKCAQILNQKLYYEKDEIKPFDFICVPKSGSPIIGYELSKLQKIPLLLHKDQKIIRFTELKEIISDKFDGQLPPKGSTALIVDDSTTTGSQLLKMLEDLESEGYKAFNAIIIFEPIGKEARARLKEKGITLSSIVSYDLSK